MRGHPADRDRRAWSSRWSSRCWILPAHLGHIGAPAASADAGPVSRAWQRVPGARRRRRSHWLIRARLPADARARPRVALPHRGRRRWPLLLITVGVVRRRLDPLRLLPAASRPTTWRACLTMPQGTPVEVTAEVGAAHRAGAPSSARELARRSRATRLIRHVLAAVGEQPFRGAQGRAALNAGGRQRGRPPRARSRSSCRRPRSATITSAEIAAALARARGRDPRRRRADLRRVAVHGRRGDQRRSSRGRTSTSCAQAAPRAQGASCAEYPGRLRHRRLLPRRQAGGQAGDQARGRGRSA